MTYWPKYYFKLQISILILSILLNEFNTVHGIRSPLLPEYNDDSFIDIDYAIIQTVPTNRLQQTTTPNLQHTTTSVLDIDKNSTNSSDFDGSVTESGLSVDASNPIFIFMCIVYTISTLSAIISNLMVILVYSFGHRTKTELSSFLVNLAIADFLAASVCMPFTFAQALLKKWIFGEFLCPIVLFAQVLTVSVSIYTLVAIGIDRYIAVKSPLKNRVTHKRGKLVLLIVWIISISLASVQLFVARLEPLEEIVNVENTFNYTSELLNCTRSNCNSYSNNSTMNNLINPKRKITYACNEIWSSAETRQTYTLFNFFAVYLIPLFILAFTYTCIACIINSTTHPGNADYSRDMHYNKSKKKVIKMLIILVCVFAICWLPLHMFILMKDFTNWLDTLPNLLWYYYAVHWLAMANCTFNPIIYGYSSKNFRSDVYSLILCCNCFRRKKWLRMPRTGNYAMNTKRTANSRFTYSDSCGNKLNNKTNQNNNASTKTNNKSYEFKYDAKNYKLMSLKKSSGTSTNPSSQQKLLAKKIEYI